MFQRCPLCGGHVMKIEKKKISITFPNPGRVFVTADECYECQKCHETYFDEEQSKKFVKRIEEVKVEHH